MNRHVSLPALTPVALAIDNRMGRKPNENPRLGGWNLPVSASVARRIGYAEHSTVAIVGRRIEAHGNRPRKKRNAGVNEHLRFKNNC